MLRDKLTIRKIDEQFKGNPRNRRFPWYLWAVMGLVVCLGITLLVITNPFTPTTPVRTDSLKAAIVDQLSETSPNPAFIQHVTLELQNTGFTVDLYKADDVTVNFYRQLPGHGYKLIIFRVHAGLLENNAGSGSNIWLFTSQPYSRLQFYLAQLRNQVTAAKVTNTTDNVFAVSAGFITDCVRHNFNNTVIINMGCSAFSSPEIAQAYVQRGASAFIGWDANVGISYADDATSALVDKLCAQNQTIKQATDETVNEKGPDPNNQAFLHFYPQSTTDKTILQLTK